MSSNPPTDAVRDVGFNVVWNWAAFATVSAVNLFQIGFALRHISVREFGLYAVASTATGLVTLLNFGLGMSVIRSVAIEAATIDPGGRSEARLLVATAHSTYVWLAFGAFAVTVVLALALPPVFHQSGVDARVFQETLLLVGLANAVTVASSSLTALVRGRRNFRLVGFSVMAGALVSVVIIVAGIGFLRVLALALATLVEAIVVCVIQAAWIRREIGWFVFKPSRIHWRDARKLLAFAAPLLIITVASKVITATDVLVVGALISAAVVTLYQVGSVIPNGFVSLLFTGYDAIFPVLAGSTSPREQEAASAFLARVFGYLAGLTFGLLALLRTDVVAVLLGHPSDLAATVMLVFCAVWVIITTTHGFHLLLIARARQRRLVGLMTAEVAANMVLTVTLVLLIGPVGAVLASLIAVLVSNWVVFPLLVRGEVAIGAPTLIFKHGLLPTALGVLVAVLGVLVAHSVAGPFPRLFVACFLAGLATLLLGAVLLRSAEGAWIRSSLGRKATA